MFTGPAGTGKHSWQWNAPALSGLNEGQKVSFDLERGQQGKLSARNLKAV